MKDRKEERPFKTGKSVKNKRPVKFLTISWQTAGRNEILRKVKKSG